MCGAASVGGRTGKCMNGWVGRWVDVGMGVGENGRGGGELKNKCQKNHQKIKTPF